MMSTVEKRSMIAVPLKTSPSLSMHDTLKQYIHDFYNEESIQYEQDLKKLDSLRTGGVSNIQIHESSCINIYKYYGQLMYIASKFPIDEQNLRIQFCWYNVFGVEKSSLTSFSLAYEITCLLFNVGAMYSQLALQESLTMPDGMKRAASFYNQASGVFNHIYEKVQSPNSTIPSSPDLLFSTLSVLISLMNAQAQECFYRKAHQDALKDSTVAKIAKKTAEFYSQALADTANSEAFNQNWIAHIRAKAGLYESIAVYHSALVDRSASKFGYELSRLQYASSLMDEVMHKSTFKILSLEGQSEVTEFNTLLKERMTTSHKDNEIIYMEIIPKYSSMPEVVGVVMSKPIPLPEMTVLVEKGWVDEPLFENLVPYGINEAMHLYNERRDKEVNELLGMCDSDNEDCHKKLAELHLPMTLDAIENPVGVPAYIKTKSREVRQHGGIQAIMDGRQQLASMSFKINQQLADYVQMLDEEEESDRNIRNQYGKRWDRRPSEDLTKRLRQGAASYYEKLSLAAKSDKVIDKKIDKYTPSIISLSSGEEELENAIPPCSSSSKVLIRDPGFLKVRLRLEEVNELMKQRKTIVESIKQVAETDDAVPQLIETVGKLNLSDGKPEASVLEDMFMCRLQERYSFLEKITNCRKYQEKLLKNLESSCNDFLSTRKKDSPLEQRERSLTSLEEGYDAFLLTMGNVKEGLKFYDDFSKLLSKFHSNVKDFVFARDLEKRDKLQAIMRESAQQESNAQELPPPGVWDPNSDLQYGSFYPSKK